MSITPMRITRSPVRPAAGRLLAGALSLAPALAVAAPAVAGGLHGTDVILTVEADRITTGRVADGGEVVPERVFVATFGESGCEPFTSNPGFNALAGTFPSGSRLGFDATAAWTRWTGDGFVHDGSFIEVSFVDAVMVVEDEPASGFDLFVQSGGGFHRHLDFCLEGCPGGCGSPAIATPGVYLLELTLSSTDPDLETSEPFWLLFDHLAPAGAVDAAGAWVEANLLGGVCPADLDDDGTVATPDLLALLAAWGDCPSPPAACPADLDDDGAVATPDLLALLAAWGDCG